MDTERRTGKVCDWKNNYLLVGGFFLTQLDLSLYSYLSNSQLTILIILMETENEAGVENNFQYLAM